MEVVVFEANSIDELKRTHSRYFVKNEPADNTAGALLAVGLVGLAVYLLHKKWGSQIWVNTALYKIGCLKVMLISS